MPASMPPSGVLAWPEWPPVKAADLLIDKERPAMPGKERKKKEPELLGGGKKRDGETEALEKGNGI